MTPSWLAWTADLLVVGGLLVVTVGVAGFARMPDVYNKLHAASKTVVFGVAALLVASAATLDPALIARSALVAGFLVLTAPVSAHAVARSAYERGEPAPYQADDPGDGEPDREPARTPRSVDETPRRRADG